MYYTDQSRRGGAERRKMVVKQRHGCWQVTGNRAAGCSLGSEVGILAREKQGLVVSVVVTASWGVTA